MDSNNTQNWDDEDLTGVYWVKLQGFSWWPARFCTLYEEINLECKAARHDGQSGMLFFEKKAKRAWVGGTNIKLFDLEHLVSKKGNDLFSLKQFSSSAGYRFAVMEAVRIALVGLRGRKIEDKALIDAVLNLMRKYEPNFPSLGRELGTSASDAEHLTCTDCGGTVYSGELRRCCSEDSTRGRCGGQNAVHFHCLERESEAVDPDLRWCCAPCAKSYGWAASQLLPEDPGLRPFLGVVDKFLPASGPGQTDQLYHVLYEDGDGEEYFLAELQEVAALYDRFLQDGHNSAQFAQLLADAADSHNSSVSGSGNGGKSRSHKGNGVVPQWTCTHPVVGMRVCKYFAGTLPRDYNAAVVADALSASLNLETDTQPQQTSNDSKDLAAVPTKPVEPVAQIRKGPGVNAARQLAVKRKLQHMLCSEAVAAVELAQASSHAIKKRQIIQVAPEEMLPLVPRDAGSSSSSDQGGRLAPMSSSSPSSTDLRQPWSLPARCIVPANNTIVAFFDECLAVLERHRGNMERARRRTLGSRTVVTQESAHQLVEDMAGDLIKTIGETLKCPVGQPP